MKTTFTPQVMDYITYNNKDIMEGNGTNQMV
jgi:hypothetical protein